MLSPVAPAPSTVGLLPPSLPSLLPMPSLLRRLLPLAHQGLEQSGVDAAHRDRLLGVIERRCVLARNGASWQALRF